MDEFTRRLVEEARKAPLTMDKMNIGTLVGQAAFEHISLDNVVFARVTEKSFDAAQRRIGLRALMTAIVIMLVFSGVVGVLWVGARDVRAGAMTVGALVQFVIYAVLVAGSVMISPRG